MSPATPARSAAEYLPVGGNLEVLRAAAAGCRGCDLFLSGTRTVFGEGPAPARLMLVGEQPGDREDVSGRPFVGPAGAVLDEALAEAGIPRDQAYVTNAVKHFKWVPRGKRRIHAKPTAGEVRACRPWLVAEIERVRPALLVCLGATAAQALLGPAFRVTRQRGVALEAVGLPVRVLATIHPSAVLRMPDDATRAGAYAGLVADLRAADAAAGHP